MVPLYFVEGLSTITQFALGNRLIGAELRSNSATFRKIAASRATMPHPLDFDPNRLSAYFYAKAIEHLFLGQKIHAVRDVVLPTVPRTRDAVMVEFSLRDGTALVSAHAVDSEELLCSAKDGDDAARDEQLATLADFPVNNFPSLVPSHRLIQFLIR